MFDITGDDIAALDDASLRELVALLSEAEAQRQGCSSAAVTAGGDQNAADGGVDVRVELQSWISVTVHSIDGGSRTKAVSR
jgi:hypothetical protein